MARQALPDLTLAFFVTLAIWSALVAWLGPPTSLEGPVDNTRSRTAWVALSAVGTAGAILTKGPVGIIIPVLVVGPLVTWEYLTGRSRAVIKVADLAIFALIVLILAAPWFLSMTALHGPTYLNRFFIAENFDRFATSRYNDPRPFWYFVPIVVGGMLPWSPFMLLWIPDVARSMRRHLTNSANVIRFGWWAAAPLLFYSLSIGKQPRYILPILPPLAVLLAHTIRSRLVNPDRDRLFNACTAMTGTLLCLIAGLVYRASPLLTEWAPSWTAGLAIAIALSGVGVLCSISLPRWTPAAVATASILVSVGGHVVLLSSPKTSPTERVAEIVRTARQNNEPYGRYQILHRNLIFYTRAPFRELGVEQAVSDFLRSPERVIIVLPTETVSNLEVQGLRVQRLGEVRYLDTGGLTLRTLLDPDPDRYLHHVVVVANRE
jgi:4-amino-4-deoxy-L-arabinose transferase-like glycosyltransferase